MKLRKSWTGGVVIGRTNSEVEEKIRKLKSESPYGKISIDVSGTPDECISKLGEYFDAGIDYVFLLAANIRDDLKLFSEEVIREFR